MIPYDDLVVALANWRARQGLPVQMPAFTASAPAPAPGSGPTSSRPGTPPPAPPPAAQAYVPPPLGEPTHDEPVDDVEEAALLEEQYENEGDDFAMAFGGLQQQPQDDGESTTIGSAPAPARDSFGGGGTDPDPDINGSSGGGRDRW